ncbi:MAG TPA: PAS domain S-box protein [Puia sp.]|nr:PAS domain S-box protein [Puia sp.]
MERHSYNNESLYHKMVEEVQDYAILMLDRNGIIVNWNKGAEKIKGYKDEEIIGTHFRIFYTQEDRDSRLPETLMEKAALEGKAVHEGWRVRKNGTAFWGSIVITAMHDEENNVIGFTKVTRDLTEKRAAENRILQYSRQLEAQNKELQQFAYAAAHDMKEPLRKILFYLSAVVENDPVIDLEKKQAYLRRSEEAARRMQSLIDDMLAFTKVSQPFEHFEEVDLNSTLREVAAFYQDSLESIRGELVISNLPSVRGIPFQLIQLFSNLVGNSIKYRHPDRSLRIEISSETVDAPYSQYKSYRPQQLKKIVVRDNGLGFEPEYNEQIFEMFQRLHGREFSGTGIGLSICKKVMDNHQGLIRAQAELNEGALFELYFPA